MNRTNKIFLMIFTLIGLWVMNVVFLTDVAYCTGFGKDSDSLLLSQSWSSVARNLPSKWYGSAEAIRIADNVLLYQGVSGGWPKNIAMHLPLSEGDKARVAEDKDLEGHTTIDNGATSLEMEYLSKVYTQTKNEKYRQAFVRGLDYLLQAQYPNGGWPQYYPLRKGYYTHITYNDNAMLNVMLILKEIANHNPKFTFVADSATVRKAKQAFDKGIDCILKTQVKQNGKLTVWCAQHDEFTLEAAKARAYELPSLCGAESAGLVKLLMGIESPSAEIVIAVKSAVVWFRLVEINGYRIIYEPGNEKKKNKIVVADASAPGMWARFYELADNRPFFCDRDGVKKYAISEIGFERRNGYGWYGDWPVKVLQDYPNWLSKWDPENKVQ
jgi:pectinesterase